MSEAIFEMAILGRVLWELHSLNNEGNVGNVIEPRSIKIIDPETKRVVTTDGISGEMLKHIHAELMWILDDKKNLCDACKVLNPERFNFVVSKNKDIYNKGDVSKVVDDALNTCDICDVHGFLVGTPTVSRKSRVEFGWALGIPDVYRDIHLHARHSTQTQAIEEVLEPGEWGNHKCSTKGCDTDPNESRLLKINGKWYCESHAPTAQMIYHRPTRTGEYAIVSLFQPWRIGLNEVKQDGYTYVTKRRKERYKLALKAYQIMFMNPQGAMTSTRLPHIMSFEGAIVYSTDNTPLPLISPLKSNYINEIEDIAGNMGISVLKFEDIKGYVNSINKLIDMEPYTMKF